jgi:hypothetical protein
VYLHRYYEGTLSRMRTEYVTPLMGKYEHHHSSLEQEILEGSPEQKRITLDLDDVVKVNYGIFGNLLADVINIHGKAFK